MYRRAAAGRSANRLQIRFLEKVNANQLSTRVSDWTIAIHIEQPKDGQDFGAV